MDEVPQFHRAAVVRVRSLLPFLLALQSRQLMKFSRPQRSDSGFQFTVRQVPTPNPRPWQVLVKLFATGICGTDAALASGHAAPARDILGHEGVGRVVKIGTGIDPGTVRLGDRVGIAWVRDICGRCPCCREPGGETRCLEQWNSGRKWDGTFAEYCVVPGRYLLVLPDSDGLADEMVAPILCGGVTAYKALKACGALPGEWEAVVGTGGVGGLAIQYARAMGYRVAAVDVGREKEESSLTAGAHAYFDALDEDVASHLRVLTCGTAAKAVVVTAGSSGAYQTSIDLVGVFGTLVCVGIPPPEGTMTIHPLLLIDRGITVLGTLAGTRTETLEALEFVRIGAVKPLVTIVGLEKVGEVLEKLGTVRTRKSFLLKVPAELILCSGPENMSCGSNCPFETDLR